MTKEPNRNSLRQRLYQEWIKNPKFSNKMYAKILKEDYKTKKGYVRKLLSEFRRYHYYEGVHNVHKRTADFYGVAYDLERAIAHGWCVSENRNRKLVYHDISRGSVEHYVNGHVIVRLIGSIPDAQIIAMFKELFSRAFSWFSDEEINRFIQAPIRETSKHYVFEMGCKLPKFQIDTFKRSHGLEIYCDGSHPTAFEVASSEPYWVTEIENGIMKLIDAIKEQSGSLDGLVQPLTDLAQLTREGMKEIKERPKFYV